jgi:hypothetical protein
MNYVGIDWVYGRAAYCAMQKVDRRWSQLGLDSETTIKEKADLFARDCAGIVEKSVEIAQATPDRLPALASVLGRAFVVEPMMRWPLGESDDHEARLVRAFEMFMGDPIRLGLVWEAGAATGALILYPRVGWTRWTTETWRCEASMNVTTAHADSTASGSGWGPSIPTSHWRCWTPSRWNPRPRAAGLARP